MLKTYLFGNKSLPPLIFLHGLFGLSEDFLPMIKFLEKDFYCIAIDLPGNGLSPLLPPLTFSTFIDNLLNTLHHLKLQRPSIVGYCNLR